MLSSREATSVDHVDMTALGGAYDQRELEGLKQTINFDLPTEFTRSL